jgi:hypothetical protein
MNAGMRGRNLSLILLMNTYALAMITQKQIAVEEILAVLSCKKILQIIDFIFQVL